MSSKRSDVWNHFVDAGDSDNKVKCVYCSQLVAISKNSTGNLLRHLKKHPDLSETSLPTERRAAKRASFKRPYKEKSLSEDEPLTYNSVIDSKNGLKKLTKILQDLAEAQVSSNSLKEQQLTVEKNRTEIFSNFLMIFKNMTEKNYSNHSTRAAACPSSSASLPTSNSKNQEMDEDRPTTFKHSQMRESHDNNHPFNVSWLTDLEIEEKKIEINERRLKLEERKAIMEGQMEERKIAMEEEKLKLETQKVTEDQPEERKLEIDKAQMKLNEQKFMLEVQIEEKKLEIDEKRLKLEKRKVFLNEQRKLCNGK